MKFKLGPRQSMIVNGTKRIVNNTPHTIELLVLNEKRPSVEIDKLPFPEKHSGPKRVNQDKAAS